MLLYINYEANLPTMQILLTQMPVKTDDLIV